MDTKRKQSAAHGSEGCRSAGAPAIPPNEGGISAHEVGTPLDRRPGGEAAAFRLEKKTHLNPPHYRVTLTDYGDGLAEIGWSFVSAHNPYKAGKGLSVNREANEDRAIRRARSSLRKKILSAGADHLLTLTYRNNVIDYQKAGVDLTRFVRLVRQAFPAWLYIAVAEQQERGAWHWHMAVRGRQDVDFLRATWRKVVGEGNIDVQPPKGRGKYRQLALVKYLGKYLAKGFAEGNRELNARRFRSSIGIEVPSQSFSIPSGSPDDITLYVLKHLCNTTGQLGFMWVADNKQAGWACSWK